MAGTDPPLTLREWRARRLLSIDDLAAKAGVSNKTVVQIEHARQVPRVGTVRDICKALGVKPEQVTEFVEAYANRAETACERQSAASRNHKPLTYSTSGDIVVGMKITKRAGRLGRPPIYDEPTGSFTVYLPESRIEQLDRIARQRKRSRSMMVDEALRLFLAVNMDSVHTDDGTISEASAA